MRNKQSMTCLHRMSAHLHANITYKDTLVYVSS